MVSHNYRQSQRDKKRPCCGSHTWEGPSDPSGAEHSGASVGLTTPVSQTSDCDTGGVEANSQMSLLAFLPVMPEGRTLDYDTGGQTPPAQSVTSS